MRLTRRWFCAGLVATPLVVAADRLMPLRGVRVPPDVLPPSWCPPGWLPCLGQELSRFQFPDLFTNTVDVGSRSGRRFRPLHAGRDTAKLQVIRPQERDQMDAYGFYDPYNQSRGRINHTVSVTITSVAHQRRANGAVVPAGCYARIDVPKDVYEATCGPVDPASVVTQVTGMSTHQPYQPLG